MIHHAVFCHAESVTRDADRGACWICRIIVLFATGLLVCLALSPRSFAQGISSASTRPAPRRVLFFTHSAGFRHPVVERPSADTLSFAERQLAQAARGRFVVDASQDPADITADNLARYDGVVFYTTGSPPMDQPGKQALLDYIRTGHGFVGIHSATDTFYDWPEYGEMIGGYFDGHPWHQEVRIDVPQRDHPSTAHLGEHFTIHDEIYQFRNFSSAKVQVLLRLDNDSVDIAKGKRADRDYALAWARSYAQGRVFYTALGHGENVWKDPRFLAHLLGGIQWATGAGEEDATSGKEHDSVNAGGRGTGARSPG